MSKKTYIYESPDGGKTLYRREFQKYDERELIRLEIENAELKDRLIRLGEDV